MRRRQHTLAPLIPCAAAFRFPSHICAAGRTRIADSAAVMVMEVSKAPRHGIRRGNGLWRGLWRTHDPPCAPPTSYVVHVAKHVLARRRSSPPGTWKGWHERAELHAVIIKPTLRRAIAHAHVRCSTPANVLQVGTAPDRWRANISKYPSSYTVYTAATPETRGPALPRTAARLLGLGAAKDPGAGHMPRGLGCIRNWAVPFLFPIGRLGARGEARPGAVSGVCLPYKYLPCAIFLQYDLTWAGLSVLGGFSECGECRLGWMYSPPVHAQRRFFWRRSEAC